MNKQIKKDVSYSLFFLFRLNNIINTKGLTFSIDCKLSAYLPLNIIFFNISFNIIHYIQTINTHKFNWTLNRHAMVLLLNFQNVFFYHSRTKENTQLSNKFKNKGFLSIIHYPYWDYSQKQIFKMLFWKLVRELIVQCIVQSGLYFNIYNDSH